MMGARVKSRAPNLAVRIRHPVFRGILDALEKVGHRAVRIEAAV